jgi:hypothetical protein
MDHALNGYGLTAELVKAIAGLAWPIAFVIAVWMFRERLTELLPRLWVKHKDWEASFRLDQAEKEAAQLTRETSFKAEEPTPEERSKFEQVAERSPVAAILEKRAELEQAVKELARTVEPDAQQHLNIASAIRTLRRLDAVQPAVSALLDDLRVIGNKAAHASDQSQYAKEDAIRFGDLADMAIAFLNGASWELASPPALDELKQRG